MHSRRKAQLTGAAKPLRRERGRQIHAPHLALQQQAKRRRLGGRSLRRESCCCTPHVAHDSVLGSCTAWLPEWAWVTAGACDLT